jgi:hypothetical protein
MANFVPRRLRQTLPKDLLIDLQDRVGAEALRAHEMVRDHSGLGGKRARELAGQARFRMMENGFQEICAEHGGMLLDGSVIPQTDLKVFQPFMRFEFHNKGVILGLAAMPSPKVLPAKNQSRAAGVSLNYYLSPRLPFDKASPKIGDIFALFLTARDRQKAGQIEELAVGVVDSKYEAFLFYEPLEAFLGGYAVRDQSSGTLKLQKPVSVSLKRNISPFVAPEKPSENGNDKEKRER